MANCGAGSSDFDETDLSVDDFIPPSLLAANDRQSRSPSGDFAADRRGSGEEWIETSHVTPLSSAGGYEVLGTGNGGAVADPGVIQHLMPPTNQKGNWPWSEADDELDGDSEAIAQEVRALLNPAHYTPNKWASVRDMLVFPKSPGGREKANKNFTEVYNQLSVIKAAAEAVEGDDAEALTGVLAACSRGRLKELIVAHANCDLLYYASSTGKPSAVEALVALGGEALIMHSQASNPKIMCTETSLHAAARAGSVRIARALLGGLEPGARMQYIQRETVVVEDRERLGVSAVHLAAMHGHVALVDYLIVEERVPVDLACTSRATAIYLAARKCQVEVVRRLLELNARTDLVDRTQMTFVHYGILSGDKDMVMLCLERSKDTSCIDQWRQSNPLLLAAYKDQVEVVNALLEDERICRLVNVPTRTFGHTALHIACSLDKDSARGRSAICNALLEAGADAMASNKQGETPLITAVFYKNVSAMVALARHFTPPRRRYFQCVTASGHSVWDYAMRSGTRGVLVTLLEIALHAYRAEEEKCRPNEAIDLSDFVAIETDAPLTTPLHAAVRSGATEHLLLLLKYMSAAAVDANGDTFLHVAARDGHESVLRKFVQDAAEVNRVNREGDTVLHVACAARRWACVRVLLPLADTSIVNSLGQTALHQLCKGCGDVDYNLLKDVVRKTTDDAWEKLILRDKDGLTALHLLVVQDLGSSAVRLLKLFYVPHRAPMPCNIADNAGDTPCHAAVAQRRIGNLEALLSVFGSGVDVNALNWKGMTPLHVAADLGVTEAIEPLLASGADVTIQDNAGNTAVHTLIRRAGEEPSTTDRCRMVLVELLRHVGTFFTHQRALRDYVPVSQPPSGCSPQLLAVILLRQLTNSSGRSALFYAVEVGSQGLLEFMLTLDGAFRLSKLGDSPELEDYSYYDVTDLVPQTVAREDCFDRAQSGNGGIALEEVSAGDRRGVAIDGPDGENGAQDRCEDAALKDRRSSAVKRRQRSRRRGSRSGAGESLVELILDDELARGHLLDLTPVTEIADDYWEPYKVVYLALMFVHVLSMCWFSYGSLSVLPGSRQALNCSVASAAHCDAPPASNIQPGLVTSVMVWPFLIILFDAVKLTGYARKVYACKSIAAAAKRQLSYVRDNQAPLFWVLGVAFSWVSVAWYIMHLTNHCQQDCTLCVALITGWLYTIHFTQGIRSVHHFALVLGRILMRDIWQFGIVFVFVLLGYSLGFHAMTYAIPAQAAAYDRFGTTIFKVFSWGAGLGEFYNETDAEYSAAGKSKEFAEAIYVTYVIALNIILLNMLVAIMNDSYAAVCEKSSASWRLSSLRRAVAFEREYPHISKLMRKWQRKDIRVDPTWPSRFFLKVSNRQSSPPEQNPEDAQKMLLVQRITAVEGIIQRLEAKGQCAAKARGEASSSSPRLALSTYLGQSALDIHEVRQSTVA